MPKAKPSHVSLHVRSFWQRAVGTSHFGSMVAVTMATNIFMACLSLVSGVLAARLLGATGRGELAAIQTWPNLLAVLSVLGIHDGLAYFSARFPGQAGRMMTTAVASSLVTCIPFAVTGYLLMPLLLNVQSPETIGAARFYLWFLLINAVLGLPSYPLRGLNDMIAWNLLRPLPTLVWLVVLVVSAVTGVASATLISQSYLFGLILLIGPVMYVALRRIPSPFVPSRQYVGPMLRYGLPSVLSTIPSTLNLRLDQMLMVAVLGPQLLGLYVVAVAWSVAATPISSALSSALLPRVAGSQEPSDQAQLLAQSTRLGSIMIILLSLGTVLATPLAIPLLFGHEYRAALPAAMILGFAAGVVVFNQLLTTGAMALGQPRYALIGETVGLVTTIILLWLLLPSYQLIGAALASLVSYCMVSAVLLVLISRRTGLKTMQLLIPGRTDIRLLATKLATLRKNPITLETS